MFYSFSSLIILSIVGRVAATPTPAELAPRCGTTLYPTRIQRLSERFPDNFFPPSNQFSVSQTGSNSNRNYVAVRFDDIPDGSYACQLNVKFPDTYYIAKTGTPTLNVTTLFKDRPMPPNLRWKTLYPDRRQSPLGQGLFGTVNLTPGQTTAINSESCPAKSGSLAYVFSIARWIEGPARVQYWQDDPIAGVYLTFNC